MTNIYIEPTRTTPLIDFKEDGNLTIEGRSVPEDAVQLYKPIIGWIENMSANVVQFHIKFEYINTSSTKQLYLLFKALAENENIYDVQIFWHYEDDDEEMLEAGEYYASLLEGLNFEYISFTEAI